MPDYSQAFAGFAESEFTHDGFTHRVFRAGSGPTVIVIHEAPGLHPGVIEFGQRVVDTGFTVFMPSLFGTPGKEFGMGYAIRSLARACVTREFTAFALDRTNPVIGWLRKLAADAHAECGGPGVGAIGMCFTGGFALGMMVDENMLAPVLSQPSLPLGPGPKRDAAAGISDDDFTRVKQRVADDGACVLGLRFSADRLVPPERFETLRRELGDGLHRGRDRLVEGEPARDQATGALRPHARSRRRARSPDAGRPRPGPRLPPGAARAYPLSVEVRS